MGCCASQPAPKPAGQKPPPADAAPATAGETQNEKSTTQMAAVPAAASTRDVTVDEATATLAGGEQSASGHQPEVPSTCDRDAVEDNGDAGTRTPEEQVSALDLLLAQAQQAIVAADEQHERELSDEDEEP